MKRGPAPGWVRLLLAALTVPTLLLMAGFVGSTGAAAQDDEFATVEIDLIGRVPWEEGRQVDARVTVQTERAISGALSVIDTPAGRSTTTFEFDIDVAANTTAVFPVVLTTGWEGVEASVVVRSGGEVVADDDLRQFGEGGGNTGTVAMLGIESPPQRVPEIGGDTQLPTLPLDGRLRGLDRASSMVATPAAVRGLGADSPELLQVEAWVRGGGQLVVDGPTGALDDSYHRFPTANPDRFAFGAGSIVYLDRWEEGVPLGGYLGRDGLRQLVESQQLGSGASGELAILANVALPAVALVAGVLLLYTVIAGPVVFGFLSARRAQRRIWLILPLLSLVFATGILGIGFAGRRGRSEAHITIVEVNDRGSRATSNLLLTSSFGGNRQIEAPVGWNYLGQGRTNGQRPVQLRLGSSATEVSLDMPPGSNAVARFSGVADQYDGRLTIDNIRFEGDEVAAEVANNGAADLTEVVAFLGNARAEVGTLPAGQSATFSIATHDDSGRTMKELLLWPRVGQEWGNNGQIAVPRDRGAETAAGAWTEWRVAQGTTASPENVLGVVGWTDEFEGPLAGVSQGRTALFVRANLPASDSGFSTTARLPSHQQPVFDGNFSGFVEDYRTTLSEGYDLDRLAIEVTEDSAALELLTEDGWLHVALPEDGEATVSLPPQAVLNGEVHFRSYVPEWVWGVGGTALMVVDAEDPLPTKALPEQRFRSVDGGGFDGPGRAVEDFDARGANEPRGLDEELLVGLPNLTSEEPYTDNGTIGFGSHHAFVVTLAEGQSMVATMRSRDNDSYLEVIDAEGGLVASNDDYGRGVDSQIQFTASVAGDYEVRAMELGNNPIDYEITVEVSE